MLNLVDICLIILETETSRQMNKYDIDIIHRKGPMSDDGDNVDTDNYFDISKALGRG
jgi:hypothetical protein